MSKDGRAIKSVHFTSLKGNTEKLIIKGDILGPLNLVSL